MGRSSLSGSISVAAAVLVLLGVVACDRSVPEARREPRPSPAAVGPRLYVSDETGGQVIVIDPDAGGVLERIQVGKRPRGIRLSRDGRQLLVALSGSPIAGPGVDESTLPPPDRRADGIGIVDIATAALLRTHRSGQDPESFDISLDGTKLYVSNEDMAEISVLDLATDAITARVKVGEEPEAVELRPDGGIVYVGCEADNEVVAVDTSTGKVVSRIVVGARPRGIVFTADGATAFVASENGGTVCVIDAARHVATGTIAIPPIDGAPTAPRPMGVVLSADGAHLFVSLGRARAIAVIDVRTRAFTRVIEDVGTRPWGIALSGDGRKLYTANGPSGDVSVVDIASGTVGRRIPTGGSPWGVVLVGPAGR